MTGRSSISGGYRLVRIAGASLALLALTSCGDESVALLNPISGSIVVSSSVSKTVTLYNPDGSFARMLRDFNVNGETPGGLASGPGGNILVPVEDSERVELINPVTGDYSVYFTNSSLSGGVANPRIATDASGTVYIAKTYSLEKFHANGSRQGAPFLSLPYYSNPMDTTPPSALQCGLATPRGMTVLGNGNLAITNSATFTRLMIFSSDATTCLQSIEPATLGGTAGDYANGLTYDAIHDKILIAFNSGEIVATDPDGSNPVTIYSNTSIIANPGAIAVDAVGNILVTSTGTARNSIEKLSYAGGISTATRVGSTPFIAPSLHTRGAYGLLVIP